MRCKNMIKSFEMYNTTKDKTHQVKMSQCKNKYTNRIKLNKFKLYTILIVSYSFKMLHIA